MSARKRWAWDRFVDKGYDRLATYNSERARGLVHTPEYAAEMAALQEQFNAERLSEAEAKGWVVVGGEGK